MPTSTDPTTDTPDTEAQTEPVVVMWLAPGDLLDNPDNPRTDLGRLTGMRDSMRILGVLEPLVVFPTDDGWMIHAGHRRKHAAIAAGLDAVPCVEMAEADRGTVIAGMIAENNVRENLTTGETVAAVQQLTLEGWSQSRIRQAGGFTAAEAKAIVAVAKSDVAASVVARFDGVTIDQALVLAEFEDDPDAVKALTVAAESSPGRFEHLASQLRRDRDYRLAREATEAALTEAGTVLYDDTAHPNAAALWRLNDADGNRLTAGTHATCPGRVVLVDDYDAERVHEFCADPEAHGHTDATASTSTSASGSSGGAMTEEQRAERREVIANNKAALAAAEVRRSHLAALLARKSAPAGTMRFAVEVMVRHASVLTDATPEATAQVLGVEAERGGWGRNPVMERLADEATDKRLPLVAVAQIAAAIEARIDKGFWRRPTRLHGLYLSYLVATGYEASEVEQIVIDALTDDD